MGECTGTGGNSKAAGPGGVEAGNMLQELAYGWSDLELGQSRRRSPDPLNQKLLAVGLRWQ